MKSQTHPLIDSAKLETASSVLRAIAHPLRLRLIKYISDKDCINVNAIYHDMGLEQSITSQHLRILREAKLVHTQRKGKFIFYTVNFSKISHIVSVVDAFLAQ